jgi:hypothetical protein
MTDRQQDSWIRLGDVLPSILARLLSELEKKAEDRLIASVRVENNKFQCQVIAHRDHRDDTVTGRAIFVLNGLRCVVDHNEHHHPQETTEMRLVQGLVQKVAEKIAVEMIAPAFRGLRHG